MAAAEDQCTGAVEAVEDRQPLRSARPDWQEHEQRNIGGKAQSRLPAAHGQGDMAAQRRRRGATQRDPGDGPDGDGPEHAQGPGGKGEYGHGPDGDAGTFPVGAEGSRHAPDGLCDNGHGHHL